MSSLAVVGPPELVTLTDWRRCQPWLEQALAHGGNRYFTLDDVLTEIGAGRAHFWPGERCAMVTELLTFPRAKVLNCWLAGGDFKEMITDMQPKIIAWAKAHGCSEVRAAGRQGWVRRLARFGYAHRFSVVGKAL